MEPIDRVDPAALTAAASALGDVARWPGAEDGEPLFAEPWEGRAFALAFDVVARTGRPWQAFRQRLIDAIAEDAERPYYRSWVVALERLVVEDVAVEANELAERRAHAATYRYRDEALGVVEVVPLRVADGHLAIVFGAVGDPAARAAVERGAAADLYHRIEPPAGGAYGARVFDATGAVLWQIELPEAQWLELRSRVT